MKRNVAIIGGGQTYHKARRHDVDQAEMVNEAVRSALKDAKMSMDEIDLVILGNMEFFEGVHMTDCWLVHATGAYGKHDRGHRGRYGGVRCSASCRQRPF
jgi:acetyl-CoA C-acetyltransferase